MTTVDDKERFLSRWSRRKLETKETQPAALPAAELPAAAPAASPAPKTEPAAPASPQHMSSEYREFFDPKVDEKLRRMALRKLFSDPHFNVMDGLDTYIDDYAKPDPIPEAMLRQLNQAKALFLFDDEKKTAEGVGDETGAAEEPYPAPPADMSVLADVAAADIPGADVPPDPPAAAPLDNAGNK